MSRKKSFLDTIRFFAQDKQEPITIGKCKPNFDRDAPFELMSGIALTLSLQ